MEKSVKSQTTLASILTRSETYNHIFNALSRMKISIVNLQNAEQQNNAKNQNITTRNSVRNHRMTFSYEHNAITKLYT